MPRKSLLVIGFQQYDEKMYPHLYDVLRLLQTYCEVTYTGDDDRGYGLCDITALLFRSLFTCHVRGLREGWGRLLQRIGRQKNIRRLLENQYDTVVAIDHNALNLATTCPVRQRVIYWSHDILTPDVHFYRIPLIHLMIIRNRMQIKKCSGIIIQDPIRGVLLDSVIHSYDVPRWYLPVSLSDDQFAREIAVRKSSAFLDSSAIRPQIRLMQITACEHRGSALLIDACQELDTSVTLSFQGHISPYVQSQIERVKRKPDLFPTAATFLDMRQRIANTDIGIVGYFRKELNERMIANASGQMVEFIRLGIPVIFFGTDTIGSIAEEQGMGLYLRDLKTLQEAIDRITGNYAEFSRNARSVYERRFDLGLYIPGLIDAIFQD